MLVGIGGNVTMLQLVGANRTYPITATTTKVPPRIYYELELWGAP